MPTSLEMYTSSYPKRIENQGRKICVANYSSPGMAHVMPRKIGIRNTHNNSLMLDSNRDQNRHASSLIHADRQIILPDVYLPKVDRTSMQYSLEARVPFLDNDVQSLVSEIGVEHLVNNNQTKNLKTTQSQ